MTLTLDDVRTMKFRIARRAGYEVMDVDQFVDQVEEAFAQLSEENGMLHQQVEALKNASPGQPVQVQSPPPQPPATPPQVDAPATGEQLVVTTSAEASQAAQRLVQMAEKVVAEAEGDAERIREDARREAHQITTDAQTRAERAESEARVLADRVSSEAKSRADQLDRQLASRRTELFTQLEAERDQLNNSVQLLRNFESTYRTNITDHLMGQLAALEESGSFEPEDRPEGVPAPAPASPGPASGGPGGNAGTEDDASTRPTATPRLDALLGDNRS